MERYALIKLRVATADDFKNSDGKTKFNAVYLQQSITGAIERNIHYITPEMDKETFKELFEASQIYVFANANEVERICVD